jgi:hypothetical protein
VALFAAGLLAAGLAACSRRESAPDVAFEPTRAVPEAIANSGSAFEAAKLVCLEEARRKGISSVTRILLFQGKTSKSDYIECMERKGFAAVKS